MKKKQTSKISDLKKGVEKKEKTPLATKEKEIKPGTKGVLSVVRTTFWILVIFVIAIGIFQILRSKQPKLVENIYRYELDASESEMAKTFAESFVRDYLTYGNDIIDDNEYKGKMDKYLVSTVSVGRPEYANGYSEVKATMVWSVEKIDATHSDIIIKADVLMVNKNKVEEKYDPVTGTKVTRPVQEEKTYYVSVPIVAENGQAAVNDYPAFVSVVNKMEVAMETYSAAALANDEETNEIQEVLEDFYDVYYSGTEGQIKSFFKLDSNLAGLESEFDFNSIKSIQIYKDNGKYMAIVVVEIQQSDIGSIFNQRHLIELEKAEDRWLILTMKNRGN